MDAQCTIYEERWNTMELRVVAYTGMSHKGILTKGTDKQFHRYMHIRTFGPWHSQIQPHPGGNETTWHKHTDPHARGTHYSTNWIFSCLCFEKLVTHKIYIYRN